MARLELVALAAALAALSLGVAVFVLWLVAVGRALREHVRRGNL